jgi:hypothetical protein
MYGRKYFMTLALTVLAVSLFPGTSSAQLFGRGRGYGGGYYSGGYYGGGYGGYYGPGYYNPGYSGVSVGIGRGYGYGYPYGGYGSTYGAMYGSPYSSYGYTTGGYYSSPNVVYSQPSVVGTTTSYSSFYPPQGVDTGCGCGCVGGTASGTTTVATGGRGTILVNVPANAEVTWNGSRSFAYGPVRYYTTLPLNNDGTTQKFEARWTGSDGQTVTRTREIQARPNETVTIDFNSDTNSATNGTPQTNATPVNRPNDATGTNSERKDAP